MAMMELRVALIILLSRFSFELPPGGDTYDAIVKKKVLSLTLHVDGGIHLRCIPRA
jgi:hypothetical protein